MIKKRYIALSLGLVTCALVLIFCIAAYLFSQTLSRVKHYSQDRMISSAEFCQQYIDLFIETSVSDHGQQEIEEWLKNYNEGTGFEHIVITDTHKIVIWSSHDLIRAGEDYSPYITDEILFAKALNDFKPFITPTITIRNSQFASLYYPGFIQDKLYMVSISADQNYFSEASRFKNLMIAGVLLLVVLSTVLLIVLYCIDKKASIAIEKSLHNERLAFLGKTSAELAHELKNPLGIMKTSVDILRKRHDPSHTDKVFGFISEEIMNLSQMIESILSFSRGKIECQEFISPRNVIEELLESFSIQYPKTRIELLLNSRLALKSDAQALKIIAANLMRNAATAVHGEAHITITSSENNKTLRISFSDKGPGINPELAKDIFKPFVSGSRNSTGIGLSIVKSLCDTMGWNISLDSFACGNTCFTIEIKDGLWRTS